MKSTGVVRQLDALGRVVLPIEIRRTLGINVKDMLEIYVNGEEIILKKSATSCVFCGSTEDIMLFKGKLICCACKSELTTE